MRPRAPSRAVHSDPLSSIEFDLADLFFRFTLESFSNMAFGRNIGALSLETDAPVPFGEFSHDLVSSTADL